MDAFKMWCKAMKTAYSIRIQQCDSKWMHKFQNFNNEEKRFEWRGESKMITATWSWPIQNHKKSYKKK